MTQASQEGKVGAYRKFVLLLTQNKPDGSPSATASETRTKLIRASHPLDTLNRLNRTKSAWTLELAIGPYEHGTGEFVQQVTQLGKSGFWAQVAACLALSTPALRFVNRTKGVLGTALRDFAD